MPSFCAGTKLSRMKAAAAVLVLLATASFAAARSLDAELVSHRRQLLAQKGMASTKALLGLDKNDKQLRVLAHGDSITEGWINTAWIKMPWTPKLQQQLQQKLGGDWRVEVQNGGMHHALVATTIRHTCMPPHAALLPVPALLTSLGPACAHVSCLHRPGWCRRAGCAEPPAAVPAGRRTWQGQALPLHRL